METHQFINVQCAVTLIYGTASVLRRRLVDQIVAAHLPEAERQWGLVALDAQELGAAGVAAQLGGGSLMADTRVVVVHNAERLPASQQNALARALRNPSPGTVVVFDCESSDDYRRKGPPVAAELRKVFESGGQIVEAGAPSDRELPQWIAEEAAARGKDMPLPVANAFVQMVGARLDLALNELDKLVTYIGPDERHVTVRDVEAVVSGERESTVFDLVDAIGQRDARKALQVLPDLIPAGGASANAMGLLAMIARQLRLVWQARALQSARLSLESDKQLPAAWADKLPGEHNFFDSTRGRRFLISKYRDQARNFSDVQLVRALVKVYETDLALKGQTEERMDERTALESLVVALCRL